MFSFDLPDHGTSRGPGKEKDKLDLIEVPLLVLTATDDNLTPVKYGTFLSKSIKNSKLVTVEDAGRFSPIEKPLEVNQAINDFLTRTFR